jgi:kinesin family protein 3/17
MEKKLVTGGQTLEDREREQVQKQREMQLQLRMQKKKEKLLQEEKRKKEEEMLLVERQYKSLQEEVDDMRGVVGKLRQKYKSAQAEIEDLKQENQFSKEDLLETVRELDKDLKFATNVMKIAFSSIELEKIKTKSHWDENRSEWRVPMFYLNISNGSKDVQFPTINGQCNLPALIRDSSCQPSQGEQRVEFRGGKLEWEA